LNGPATGGPCPDENELSGFLQGTLPENDLTRLETHIDGCDRCSALVAETARLMGEGAMGVVYLAHDPVLGREVALKLIRPDLFLEPGGDDLRKRFDREARLLARLSHPNVVAVYDAGEADKGMYIAMEYVPGMPLSEWAAGQNRPGWQIVEVFLQAGRGLAAAHRAGLIHRDVKPHNILVGEDGRARITDFGLAIPAGAPGRAGVDDPAEAVRLTRTGQVVGTPAYMAPEQLAGLKVDARSDQYGFCASLFEALLGRQAVDREQWVAAALEGSSRKRSVPRGGHAGKRRLPGSVQEALGRGLRNDPDERFESMDGLVLKLADGASADAWRPRRKLWITIGAAAAAVIAVAAVWIALRSQPADPSRRGSKTAAGKKKTPRPLTVKLTEYRFENGGFAVRLPGSPKRTEEHVPTPMGNIKYRGVTVTYRGDECGTVMGCQFAVGWVAYPASWAKFTVGEDAMDGARNGVVRHLKGKLVSSKKIRIHGHPALDFVISAPAPSPYSGKATARGRMVHTGNRMIQMIGLTAAKHGSNPVIPAVLNSFRLLKKK
jgi:tRNA A-37 threonylcarbamoyl transferase component Bud32